MSILTVRAESCRSNCSSGQEKAKSAGPVLTTAPVDSIQEHNASVRMDSEPEEYCYDEYCYEDSRLSLDSTVR